MRFIFVDIKLFISESYQIIKRELQLSYVHLFSDKETLNKVLWDHHVENHSSKISRRNILICCLLGNKFNCLQ